MPARARQVAFLATLALVACSFAAVASTPSHVYAYHGWHVDASHVPDLSQDSVMAPVQKQIDAIETRGIAQDIVEFMRTVPLHAEKASRDAAPAHSAGKEKGIDFQLDALDPKKPVLLHELLRAFHEQKLRSSDTIINDAYQASRASGVWPADSAMMKSPQEFFAATATVYLAGAIDTPPVTPGRLHEAQPEYWKWLGEVFDGFRGCE
jgi:hypothetical protein